MEPRRAVSTNHVRPPSWFLVIAIAGTPSKRAWKVLEADSQPVYAERLVCLWVLPHRTADATKPATVSASPSVRMPAGIAPPPVSI